MAKQSTTFALTFVALFALAFMFLAGVDMLPEPVSSQSLSQPDHFAQDSASPEMPVRIVAKSIGLDKTTANPASTDVETLDTALLGGTARYPTSARLGEEGRGLFFGPPRSPPLRR